MSISKKKFQHTRILALCIQLLFILSLLWLQSSTIVVLGQEPFPSPLPSNVVQPTPSESLPITDPPPPAPSSSSVPPIPQPSPSSPTPIPSASVGQPPIPEPSPVVPEESEDDPLPETKTIFYGQLVSVDKNMLGRTTIFQIPLGNNQYFNMDIINPMDTFKFRVTSSGTSNMHSGSSYPRNTFVGNWRFQVSGYNKTIPVYNIMMRYQYAPTSLPSAISDETLRFAYYVDDVSGWRWFKQGNGLDTVGHFVIQGSSSRAELSSSITDIALLGGRIMAQAPEGMTKADFGSYVPLQTNSANPIAYYLPSRPEFPQWLVINVNNPDIASNLKVTNRGSRSAYPNAFMPQANLLFYFDVEFDGSSAPNVNSLSISYLFDSQMIPDTVSSVLFTHWSKTKWKYFASSPTINNGNSALSQIVDMRSEFQGNLLNIGVFSGVQYTDPGEQGGGGVKNSPQPGKPPSANPSSDGNFVAESSGNSNQVMNLTYLFGLLSVVMLVMFRRNGAFV